MANRRLNKSLKQSFGKKAERVITIAGELGLTLNGQKLIEVPNRKGYVYVRLRNSTSEVIQAYNSEVSTIYGLAVLVAYKNNGYKVIGRDLDRYQDWGNIPYLPKHGGQHSFNQALGMGADITWVYPQQFMPLLGYPSGTNGSNGIVVAPQLIRDLSGNWKYVGNTGTPDITMYRPSIATGAVMVLVYVDTVSGNPYLLVGSGTTFHAGITGSGDIAKYIPQIPNPNWMPNTAVRLTSGTTQITWTNLYDARPFLQVIPTGSAGSGGSVDTGTLNALYLRLDASNDPVTGFLEIIPSPGAPGLNIQTLGDVSGLEVTQSATGSAGSILSNTFTANREPSGDSVASFDSALFALSQSRGNSGSITGPMWEITSNGSIRSSYNPSAQGTGTLLYYDGDNTLSPGGMLLLLKNHGTPRFYVNASGTAHSNNVPLIKEAPTDSNTYVRKNAGWEQVFITGSSVALVEDLSSQVSGTQTRFILTRPVSTNGILLLYNGLAQRYGVHYLVSGTFVDTLFTPTTGSNLLAVEMGVFATGTSQTSFSVQDEGANQGSATTLNFVGAGVSASVASSTATILITGSSTAYPKAIDMWGDQSIKVTGSALTIGLDAAQIYATYTYHSSPAIGDTTENSFVCAAGTYTLNILGTTNSNYGIMTVLIDGVSKGTLDWYSASVARNVLKSIASIVLTEGYHRITFFMGSKNASSSGYQYTNTKMWLVPASY